METTCKTFYPTGSQSGIDNETFLTEKEITAIKQMFKTKADYINYVEALWMVRDLTIRNEPPIGSPQYKVFKMANDFIGTLLLGHPNFIFESSNGFVTILEKSGNTTTVIR